MTAMKVSHHNCAFLIQTRQKLPIAKQTDPNLLHSTQPQLCPISCPIAQHCTVRHTGTAMQCPHCAAPCIREAPKPPRAPAQHKGFSLCPAMKSAHFANKNISILLTAYGLLLFYSNFFSFKIGDFFFRSICTRPPPQILVAKSTCQGSTSKAYCMVLGSQGWSVVGSPRGSSSAVGPPHKQNPEQECCKPASCCRSPILSYCHGETSNVPSASSNLC